MPLSLTVSLALSLVVASPSKPPAPPVDVVSRFNQVALEAGRAQSLLMQARALAIVHAAMFDAANGIDRRFEPYLVDERPATTTKPDPVAPVAAAAGAAHAALVALYPERRGTIDVALNAALASIPKGAACDDAVAFGATIADKIVSSRRNDGAIPARPELATYANGKDAGRWRAEVPALAPHWGGVAPFLVDDVAAFAPPPPPAFTSA